MSSASEQLQKIEGILQQAIDQPDQAATLKASAVPIAYNLAADTWQGWAESAPVPQEDQTIGMKAAQLNIQLAAESGFGPQRRKNGYWIYGAHLIANSRFDDAVSAFETSRNLAIEAADEPAELMAQGWIHASNILAGHGDEGALELIKQKLQTLGDDGKFYADQFEPALATFSN